MPIYDFVNNKTGQEERYSMKISDKDKFLEDNPDLKQVILGAPMTVRSVGGIRNDDGWKENLSRISEAHPNSALADKLGGKSVSQSKVDQIAAKHGHRDKGKYTMDL
jgi:hypothetical protein